MRKFEVLGSRFETELFSPNAEVERGAGGLRSAGFQPAFGEPARRAGWKPALQRVAKSAARRDYGMEIGPGTTR